METTAPELTQSNTADAPAEPIFKRIGPISRSSLVGVKYDIKSGQYSSFLTVRKTGKVQQIGLFFTEEQAAIAHDMQALKIYSLQAEDDLNYSYLYEVESENRSPSVSNRIIKLKMSGVMINIECDPELEVFPIEKPLGQPATASSAPSWEVIPESAAPVVAGVALPGVAAAAIVPVVPAVEAEAVDSLICSPPGTAAVLPGKTDVNRRWHDRLVSSFYPTAAFAYEVTFMQQSSLGLQLRPLFLTYPVAAGKRTLGCCVVIDASQSPSQLVQAGDILVSVNGLSLVGAQNQIGDQRDSQKEGSGGFSFDASVKAISHAVAPRTIRFLRTAGLSVNQQLSPGEASLLVSEQVYPIAKYTVEQSASTGGGPHPTLLYLDNQVRQTGRKLENPKYRNF